MKGLSREVIRPNIVSFTLSLIVAFLLWAKDIFMPDANYDNKLFFNIFHFPEHNVWIGFISTVGMAYLLFKALDKISFIQQRTFLPFFVFILLAGGNTPLHSLTNGIIGSFFLLLSIWQVYSTFHKNEPIQEVFNAGMFLSIGYFFVFDFLFLIPVVFINFLIINNLSLRIFLSTLLGLLTPAIIIFGFSFWMGSMDAQLNYFNNGIQFDFDFSIVNHLSLVFTGIFTLISLISLFGCYQNRFNSSVSERKNLQVIVWYFAAILILIWIRITQKSEILPSFLVICTLLISIFFSTRFSKKNTILFIVLILFQVINLILGYNGQFS